MLEVPTKREAKRHDTAVRLQRHALELTLDRGFDGWTVDDVAHAAGVSRRTVFNYVDGKADLVLGPLPDTGDERFAEFVAGGPTGNLLDDLVVAARDVLEEKASERDLLAVRRQVVLSEPRLAALVHERLETLAEQFVGHIRQREGAGFAATRARLLLGLVVVIFDSALQRGAVEPDRPFSDLFADAVADARAVLT